jgi:hypothetical protein
MPLGNEGLSCVLVFVWTLKWLPWATIVGDPFAFNVRLIAEVSAQKGTPLVGHRSANRTLEFQRRIMRRHFKRLQQWPHAKGQTCQKSAEPNPGEGSAAKHSCNFPFLESDIMLSLPEMMIILGQYCGK